MIKLGFLSFSNINETVASLASAIGDQIKIIKYSLIKYRHMKRVNEFKYIPSDSMNLNIYLVIQWI